MKLYSSLLLSFIFFWQAKHERGKCTPLRRSRVMHKWGIKKLAPNFSIQWVYVTVILTEWTVLESHCTSAYHHIYNVKSFIRSIVLLLLHNWIHSTTTIWSTGSDIIPATKWQRITLWLQILLIQRIQTVSLNNDEALDEIVIFSLSVCSSKR